MILKKHKVIVLMEFKSTARYLAKQLNEMVSPVLMLLTPVHRKIEHIWIQRFARHNGSSSPELSSAGKKEIQILISTDVLAEGAEPSRLHKIDKLRHHWNPVRLMQRIGRIDRRMNLEIENKILEHHPDTSKIRGTAAYWNFLPPGELDTLLKLHKKVLNKTLRISKVLGLEGGKLLKPDDDFDDLKDFDELYEGKTILMKVFILNIKNSYWKTLN